MIRVLLLALAGLVALVIVAHHVPAPLAARPDDMASPFSRREGTWEGTFTSYRPDGTMVDTLQVRHEYQRVSDTQQTVVISDRHADGRTSTSTGRDTVNGDALECRLTNPDGTLRILTGRRVGETLFWRRHDELRGIDESYREQILQTPAGDLYTVDGAGVYGKDDRGMLLFEGRYRRVDRAGE